MYENDTGYPTSELISRLFTGCHLPFNFHPKKFSTEENEEKLDLFVNIGYFNYILFLIENGFVNKFLILAELKFPENFLKAIINPTEKTKKSADNYITWYKMCCHLKFLLNNKKGLDYFKSFSSLSKKYDEKDCENFWEKCNPTFGSISGVFSLIDKYVPPEPELDKRSLIKKSFFKTFK